MADRKLSLLEQAKAMPSAPKGTLDLDRADVLLAWVRGELESGVVRDVLKMKHTNGVYTSAGSTMRALYRRGLLDISWKENK